MLTLIYSAFRISTVAYHMEKLSEFPAKELLSVLAAELCPVAFSWGCNALFDSFESLGDAPVRQGLN